MLLFSDEIDAIAAKRETAQRQMEHRIVAQMLTCMDDLSEAALPMRVEGAVSDDQPEDAADAAPAKHVVVLAATNRPDALDAALRYHQLRCTPPGCFASKKVLSIPSGGQVGSTGK